MRRGTVVIVAALLAALGLGVHSGPLRGEATIRNFRPVKETLSYPAFDAAGNQLADAQWRVASRTTNSYENYLTTTAAGRLLNFGGSHLTYSDDRGLNWKEVVPSAPGALQSAEGTVVIAPGGDVVGATWDPYSGDRVFAIKYDAALGKWFYEPVLLHTPFYDRPWLGVLPGPVNLGDRTVPYVALLKGAYPFKEVWSVSYDGLEYSELESKTLEALPSATRRLFPDAVAHPDADRFQPHARTAMTPVAGVGLLARSDFIGTCGWYLLDINAHWSCYSLPDGSAPARGTLLTDTSGRLHDVVANGSQLTYRLSSDGGRTWTQTQVGLPANHRVEDYDVRIDSALGLAAVAVHAHDSARNTDRDIAYKFSITTATASLLGSLYVGLGDMSFGGGFGENGNVRFDFSSVAIFPDGKLAVSFADSAHADPAGAGTPGPAIAVEL